MVLLISLSIIAWLLVVFLGIPISLVVGPDAPAKFSLIPVYGLPALFVWYGVARARLGFILVPVSIAAMSFVSSSVLRLQDHAAIDSFPVAPLAPASRSHAVLAVEGLGVECDRACYRIIATSELTLARKVPNSRDWVLFRRGDHCRDEAQVVSALEFLSNGYHGVCATRSTARDIGDALVFRARSSSGDQPVPAVPHRFRGVVYEISERTAGKERLLGRRLVGDLQPPFPYVIGAFRPRDVEAIDAGLKIDVKEFLAIGTGISAATLYAGPPPSSFAERLDEAESYFDFGSTEIANRAAGVWTGIAANYGRTHQDELRPRVERMLESEDARRFRTGLNGLFSLTPANQAFAQQRILDLAFSPLLTTKYSSIVWTIRSLLQSSPEPFPAAIRERAKALLVADATLTRPQRQLFFVIMARGGPGMRREAVDTVFSLEGALFEESVDAIGRESDVWDGHTPKEWSRDEIDRLIERAPGVPNERLSSYLRVFRFGNSVSKEQKASLVVQVRERLHAAEMAPVRDETQIKELKRLIEVIPHNISS